MGKNIQDFQDDANIQAFCLIIWVYWKATQFR
jgi:hypothetical protein